MKKNILMVYPEYPHTYWSLQDSIKFVNKKAHMPPLGLMTIAAMLPAHYKVKLVDMNVEKLNEKDILWADYIFLSAMIIQKESFKEVIEKCNTLNRPVVAGGPYPTSANELIEGVSHFIIGEGEDIVPLFIHDLEKGTAKHIYRAEKKPDITKTPIPRYDIIDINDYASMAIQYSRGCPFSCEFCDIIEMFGRTPRLKTADQFIKELQCIYDTGYRGPMLIVDDNFIGNKKEVTLLLKQIRDWQKARNYPFDLFTESSINLAAETEILDLMIASGFSMVFLGLETPDIPTLAAVDKHQNIKHNLIESVITIQSKGLEVTAGLIVGFDTDTEDIFDRQIDFIQKAGIPMAMIGIIIVLPGTRLYKRLEKEGRLIAESSGNNTNMLDMNFIPKMDKTKIIKGYRKILQKIYTPEKYFDRSLLLLSRMPKKQAVTRKLQQGYVKAFFKSLILLGFTNYGLLYFKYLVKALLINRNHFPLAVNLAIKGYHFFRLTEKTLSEPLENEKDLIEAKQVDSEFIEAEVFSS